MQQMICGNTQAELERDTDTEAKERIRNQELSEMWRWARDELLAGRKVYTFGGVFELNERIINKYSEVFNSDFDFMTAYLSGELHPDIRRLLEREADSLASIISG